MTIPFVRDEERIATPPAGPVTGAPMTGLWRNCDHGESGGIRDIVIADAGDNALTVRAYGVGDPDYDWGEAVVSPFATGPSGTDGWGWVTRYDFGNLSAYLSAYMKPGILIVTSYNTFAKGDGRADYWTREFYYRPVGGTAPERTVVAEAEAARSRDQLADPHSPVHPYTVDPGPVIATWRNVDPDSGGITEVRVTPGPDGPVAAMTGTDTEGASVLESAPIQVFSEDVAATPAVAFTVEYDTGFEVVEAVGYVNRRLLTVDAATRYADGDPRSNYFSRAHFYPL